MKALKIILIVLLTLVVLFGGCVYLFVSNIDRMLAGAIEAIATEAMQTEVEVEQVKLTFSTGRGEIHGLNIANLEGFDEPTLFSLKQVALQVNPATLGEPVVVIDEILVDGARLTVEHKNLTETNLQALMENIQAQTDTTYESSHENEVRFMVRRLSFTDISMDVVSPEFERQSINLPDIIRENLGNRETGLSGAELVEAVVQPLIDNARNSLEEQATDRVGDELKRALERELTE